MKKRYFVSLKNGWLWLSVLAMVLTCISRIWVGCITPMVGWEFPMLVVLPMLSALYFCFILLFQGKTHFYRCAVGVWGFALSQCFLTATAVDSLRMLCLFCICYLFLSVLFTVITSGRMGHGWVAVLALLALLAVALYDSRQVILGGGTLVAVLHMVQNVTILLAFLCATFAMEPFPEGSGYHATWGDRSDGRRVRTLPGITNVIPYIMPTRNQANNHITDKVDIGEMERYIWKKRREGLKNFGVTHVFFLAYLRMVAQYPAINRFCAGQKIYSHGNDVIYSMAIKKEMTTEAPDTTIKLHFTPDQSVESVYEMFDNAVKEVKGTPLDSNVDNTIRALTCIPGIFLALTVGLLRGLDYLGLIPPFLLEVSPFHGSVFFTSMGSLGIPPVVHHLYDFGNLPVFMAFGSKQKVREITADGLVVTKKYIQYTANTDERITDGFYFAAGMKVMKRYLEHPEKLDEPVVVKDDVE